MQGAVHGAGNDRDKGRLGQCKADSRTGMEEEYGKVGRITGMLEAGHRRAGAARLSSKGSKCTPGHSHHCTVTCSTLSLLLLASEWPSTVLTFQTALSFALQSMVVHRNL